MKKFVTAIAVLALLIACMVPAAFAAGTYTAVVGDVEVEMGEGVATVKVPVSVEGTSVDGLEFNGFTVSEGAKIVKVESAVSGAMFFYVNGNATMIYADTEDNHLTGTLLYVVVEVPADEVATYTVSFTSGTITSVENDLSLEPVAVKEGKITIAHECKPGEPVKENEKAPTCTEKGSYDEVVYCTICKKELSRKTITVDALGHKPGEWEVVAEATCVADGKKVQKCSVCGEVVAEEVLKALGHDLIVSKAPEKYDCDTGYLQTTTCSRCDLKEEKTITHEHAIHEYTTETKEEEKDGKVVTFAHKVEKCAHGVEGKDGYHGCSYEKDLGWVEIGDRPVTGDITPYIAMGVLTMVALISAAAYMLLKRKAI